MVELTLPRNSKVGKGRHHPAPARSEERQAVQGLPLGPGGDRQSDLGHLRHRRRRRRPDGARRPEPQQKRHRLHPDVPLRSCREGVCRLLRQGEHRRPKYARLHPRLGRGPGQGGGDLSPAPSAGRQGPRPGSDDVLRPVRLHRTLAAHQHAGAANRVASVGGGPREARRPLRMHPLRLLHDLLPKLLVERREVPRTGDVAAGPPLAGRQPRRGDRRAPGRAGRPLQAVPLPHHHELLPGLLPARV